MPNVIGILAESGLSCGRHAYNVAFTDLLVPQRRHHQAAQVGLAVTDARDAVNPLLVAEPEAHVPVDDRPALLLAWVEVRRQRALGLDPATRRSGSRPAFEAHADATDESRICLVISLTPFVSRSRRTPGPGRGPNDATSARRRPSQIPG